MSSCTIVIPVFKSSKSLVQLVQEIENLNEKSEHLFDVIFVNDSPRSEVTNIALSEIEATHTIAKVIQMRKNRGQHVALLVGISQAKGEYIITMDDDLQHPVSEVPKLLAAIDGNKNVEAVFALPRISQKKHSLYRNAGSYMLNKLDVWFLEKPKGLVKSPFRIMSKDISQVIVKNHNAMPSISSLIIDATDAIINLEVMHEKRQYGKSNYGLKQLISLTLNNIIHYSSLPLKAVGILGLVGFGASILFIIFTVLRRVFFDIAFPGYASTVSLISFFGGLQLFALGIIGEYLIRIVKEQQKRELTDLIKE